MKVGHPRNYCDGFQDDLMLKKMNCFLTVRSTLTHPSDFSWYSLTMHVNDGMCTLYSRIISWQCFMLTSHSFGFIQLICFFSRVGVLSLLTPSCAFAHHT